MSSLIKGGRYFCSPPRKSNVGNAVNILIGDKNKSHGHVDICPGYAMNQNIKKAFKTSSKTYDSSKMTSDNNKKNGIQISYTRRNVGLAYTFYPKNEEIESDESKTPILMLHGLFGARGNFHSVCKSLSKDGRKIVPYDCRNHGDSEHSPEFNFGVMAEDAVDLASDLDLRTPIILGHSLGGKTAMTAALLQPDLWSALIVGDIAPQFSPQMLGLKTIAEAMKKVKVTPGIGIVKARTQARTQLSSTIQEKFILEFLLTNLREFGPKTISWRFNLDALIDNLDQLADFPDLGVEPCTKPTLFVFGENSDHYKNADKGLIKALFPNAVIEAIPEAGHFIHAEKPLEFVEIVNNFVGPIDNA